MIKISGKNIRQNRLKDFFETISVAYASFNVLTVDAELLAQTSETSVNGAVANYHIASPYVADDFLARVYSITVLEEEE